MIFEKEKKETKRLLNWLKQLCLENVNAMQSYEDANEFINAKTAAEDLVLLYDFMAKLQGFANDDFNPIN